MWRGDSGLEGHPRRGSPPPTEPCGGGGKVPAEIPGAPQEIPRTKASPGAYTPPPPQVRQVKPGPNFLSSSSPGHPEEPAVTGGAGGRGSKRGEEV